MINSGINSGDINNTQNTVFKPFLPTVVPDRANRSFVERGVRLSGWLELSSS
jgi:hypothetical protein